MSAESEPSDANASDEIRDRILGAAFSAFMEKGYPGVSMLEIATRARISKRDLYARFANKQAVLAACIQSRAARLPARQDLPPLRDRSSLEHVLTGLGATVVTVVCDPAVIAMFQFAIAEARRAPQVAQELNAQGRTATRQALAGLFAKAQGAGLIDEGDAVEMAEQYVGLLWEGLQVGLLMGVADAPTPEHIQRRAAKATAAFLALHAPPA